MVGCTVAQCFWCISNERTIWGSNPPFLGPSWPSPAASQAELLCVNPLAAAPAPGRRIVLRVSPVLVRRGGEEEMNARSFDEQN